jgi:DNA-binding NtrC family response regulator
MRKLYETVDRLRGVELPVLITGETGVGKELVARAVHRTSPRKDGPFYALRCASLPPQLFESELFGYEAGAFTGAEESRPGLLEHLGGGTLLLDEITELSRETQTKLLQVIDTKVVRPLGSLEPRPVDVRFLASTREDAAESVREGALGADLYYRLRAVEIHVPPLRERREDIPLLVRQLLRRHAQKLNRSPPTLSQAALRRLGEHDWPGNVRELESLVERLLIERGAGAVVDAGDVRALLGPLKARSLFPPDLLAGRDIEDLRRELDRAYLERVFQESGGRIPEILDALRIRRSTLYAWMRRVGLDVKDLRGLL